MNMTVTESDKKLLSFLAAFMLFVFFVFFVFRPLIDNITTQKKEIAKIEEQKREQDLSASLLSDIGNSEEMTRDQLVKVLQRFYPNIQSYECENMITILALNHNLKVQNLSIIMPEKKSDLKWYQYANRAQENTEFFGIDEEEEESLFGIYAARITCNLSGDETDMLSLLDDLSENYPAISILSAEWATKQQVEASSLSLLESTEEDEATENVNLASRQTVLKNVSELSLIVEIYMCEQ